MGMPLLALLGPTNTGKTHQALERMLEHRSGAIGLPLRLLAREVYERATAKVGESRVALVTGEEKRVPRFPDYWVCTTESMPQGIDVDFLCVDEVQMAAHRQRGHTFTDRILHARGAKETWFLGAETMRPLLSELVPTAQVQRMQRFSSLRYSGVHSLGSLPPRTAVVAFSVQEVYELAERLRQLHGGTAVVLGALSPRTRNAQVAMYESGEVDYLVATDAIGMGLNLDVDRVVFATLQKFDGRELRELEPAEIGQIAGRAGRYLRDGTFGCLRPHRGLSPRLFTMVEQHDFPPVRRAVWRNHELDFTSVSALVESLRIPPRRACLRLVEQADDYDALVSLAKHPEIVAACNNPERVALLWDVCRIPDFRKLLLDSHIQFIAEIFAHLMGPTGQVDEDWMAGRIAHLDDVDGTIDALTNRMSFIRTWTYVTHQDGWIRDPSAWQTRTREIEDRQSDALHARLTERFVDRVGGTTRPARARKRARARGRTPEAEPLAPADHPFGALAALLVPEHPMTAMEVGDRWVDAIVDAEHAAFDLDDQGLIRAHGRALARLHAGADVLRPDVVMLELPEVGAGAVHRLHRRVVAWTRDATAQLVERATEGKGVGLSSAARGVLYQLGHGLGSVDFLHAKAQLSRLTAGDRDALAEQGVVLGRVGVFLPESLSPEHRGLRAVLWSVHHGVPLPVARLRTEGVSFRPYPELPRSAYPSLGFLVRAGRAIRIDALHAVCVEVERAVEHGPAVLDLGAWPGLGLGSRRLATVLRALGFRCDGSRWSA